MLESGLSGSVRGAPSNGRPYRNPRPRAAAGAMIRDTPAIRSMYKSAAGHVVQRRRLIPPIPSAARQLVKSSKGTDDPNRFGADRLASL
jgi:hypothetical protein